MSRVRKVVAWLVLLAVVAAPTAALVYALSRPAEAKPIRAYIEIAFEPPMLLFETAAWRQAARVPFTLVMESEKHHRKALDVARLVGYLFTAKLAGWRRFCAGLNLDPEICWACLPGYDRVKRAEAAAGHTAFTPEGVVAYLRREDRDAELITADDIAAGLRECLETRAEWWG